MLLVRSRRLSAAERHAILLAGLTGVLLIPVFAMILPVLSPHSIPPPEANATLREWSDNALGLLMVREDAHSSVPLRTSWRAVMEQNNAAILIIWLTGTGLILLRIATNLVASSRVRAGALMRRNIGSGHLLFESSDIGTPVVLGIFRPVIIVPRGSVPAGAVLTHEVAHITRRDCLTSLLTQIVCALYWFNPVVWAAARRCALEQERAVDDCVLASGEDPVGYSELLLETARGQLSALRLHAASSMALPSHLERRIARILEARAARGPLSRRAMAIIAMVTLCLSLPMAALALHDGITHGVDAFADPQSERVPGIRDFHGCAVGYDASTVDGTLIATLADAAGRDSHSPYDLVPDRARWALSLVHDGRIIEPLMVALRDPDWRVCAYAAWALGYSGDPRAVDALLPLLDHPVWRVRAIGASALRSLGDPRARTKMAKALRDPAWQVRVEAVAYFGAQDQTTFREQLVPLRNDPHIAVRLAADESLN
jgi:beta-lactamase regulating signal transducer with metallopeptidase domain